MHINILAFAVPLFISFMLLEYHLSKKKQKEIFHFDEAIANLNIGIAERLTDLFSTGLFYLFFVWLHKNMSLFSIKPSVLTWVVLFLVTDFIWYWYHRFGHTINIFWAAHVVHHQSNDYNFTTSVRVTFFQTVARSLFWSILPIFGFPPDMITLFLLIHGAYPFFTHTQLIGKLGFLEIFLVTPSHHRVHHSNNEEYLDKNYGDILIIWDKLFGTFVEEKSKPEYGLTKPLYSHSFLWQMFHFPLEMLVAFTKATGFKEKLKILFGKPDDINPQVRTLLERKFNIKKTAKHSSSLNWYLKLQSIFTLAILFFTILFDQYITTFQIIIIGIFIIVSIINTGAILEQRKWILNLEYLRLTLLCIFLTLFFFNIFIIFSVVILLFICVCFYKPINQYYFDFFYD